MNKEDSWLRWRTFTQSKWI